MKIIHFVVSALFLLSLFVVPPVLALDDDYAFSEITEDATAAATEEYWTDERMRNALPYPMYSPEGPAAAVDLAARGNIPSQAFNV